VGGRPRSGRVVEHRLPPGGDWSLHPERRLIEAARGGQEPPLDTRELARVRAAPARGAVRVTAERGGRSPATAWSSPGPVTAATHAEDGDQRPWYLSLHRSFDSLLHLRRSVEEDRLPALDAEARALAGVALESLSDGELGDEIDRRIAAHDRWVDIYWSEFIPLAHGIRMFGPVYNDVVRHADPYQFRTCWSTRPPRRAASPARALLARGQAGAAAAVRGGGVEAADRLHGRAAAFLGEFRTAFGNAQCFAERRRIIAALSSPAAGARGRPASGDQRSDRRVLDRVNPTAGGRASCWTRRSSYRLRDDDNLHLGGQGQVLTEAARACAVGPRSGGDSRTAAWRSLRDPTCRSRRRRPRAIDQSQLHRPPAPAGGPASHARDRLRAARSSARAATST
jgi:pyruvate,water dikinase